MTRRRPPRPWRVGPICSPISPISSPDGAVRPRTILLTALITAEIDGEHMSEDELFAMCVLLLVAGNETTTNLLSNSAVQFNQHPDQWRAIVDRPLSASRRHRGVPAFRLSGPGAGQDAHS